MRLNKFLTTVVFAILPSIALASFPTCPNNIQFSSSPTEYTAIQDDASGLFDILNNTPTHINNVPWLVLTVNIPGSNESDAINFFTTHLPTSLSSNPSEINVGDDDGKNAIYVCIYNTSISGASHAFVATATVAPGTSLSDHIIDQRIHARLGV